MGKWVVVSGGGKIAVGVGVSEGIEVAVIMD